MDFLYKFAQDGRLDLNQVKVPTVTPESAVQTVLSTVYLWAGIICVIIIIVAGFLYVTSAGNAASIKKAKDAILGAVIGLIMTILAFAITVFVIGRL